MIHDEDKVLLPDLFGRWNRLLSRQKIDVYITVKRNNAPAGPAPASMPRGRAENSDSMQSVGSCTCNYILERSDQNLLQRQQTLRLKEMLRVYFPNHVIMSCEQAGHVVVSRGATDSMRVPLVKVSVNSVANPKGNSTSYLIAVSSIRDARKGKILGNILVKGSAGIQHYCWIQNGKISYTL